MRRLNVERMSHYVDRTTPDTVTLSSLADDYHERLAHWRSRMYAKHGGGHIDLHLDPATGLVTASYCDGPV